MSSLSVNFRIQCINFVIEQQEHSLKGCEVNIEIWLVLVTAVVDTVYTDRAMSVPLN